MGECSVPLCQPPVSKIREIRTTFPTINIDRLDCKKALSIPFHMMETYYLDAASNEGLDVWWAYTGLPLEHRLETCALCLQRDCIDPQYMKLYSDGIWYMDLGTTTRYADVKGRTRSSGALRGIVYKNVMLLHGDRALVHLGNVQGSKASHWLLFDRLHIHRVISEMIVGGNSLRVEATSGSSSLNSFRARWNETPSSGGSPLFHRWLLLEPMTTSHFVVEHRNDIPLDCREGNLKLANTLVDNNNQTHRISRAFRGESDIGFHRILKQMRLERDEYDELVRSLPPLPDCVFSNKVLSKATSNVEDTNQGVIFIDSP